MDDFEQLPVELAEKESFYRLVHCNDRISRTSPRILYEKAVNMNEDQLTALHVAFMNSGIFLYVPKMS